LKNPKRTKNILKLCYYFAFKHTIKQNYFVEKPKFKKDENPYFALLIVSKSRNHSPPPDLEGLGGEGAQDPLFQNHYIPTTNMPLGVAGERSVHY
jgi:hypothetical protein